MERPGMTACPHGFPKPANCFTCMEDGNLAPPQQSPPVERDGPVISAQYDGHCYLCNTGIHVGQRIVRTTDGLYVHAKCLP